MPEENAVGAIHHLIADRIPEGVLVVRASDKVILFANQAFQKMFGYGSEELVGRPVSAISASSHDSEEAARQIAEALSHSDSWRGEIKTQKKDGEHFWCQVSVSASDHPAYGKVQFGTYVDITQHKETEERLMLTAEQLAHSNGELEQFAYVVSHELQEPLRTVAGFLQLLESRYKDKFDNQADHFIERSVEGAKRMQALIEGLLFYAKLTGGAKPFDRIDCLEALAQVLTSLEAAITKSGAVITHDPLPVVLGERVQLSTVFQNLISNAIKFASSSGSQPKIHIGAKRNGREWVFFVCDNGIGIDPEFFPRIFGIFERLNVQSKYPGSGIGLAICKKIVEQHGGRIWVTSEAGKGSTFYFSLPANGGE